MDSKYSRILILRNLCLFSPITQETVFSQTKWFSLNDVGHSSEQTLQILGLSLLFDKNQNCQMNRSEI